MNIGPEDTADSSNDGGYSMVDLVTTEWGDENVTVSESDE